MTLKTIVKSILFRPGIHQYTIRGGALKGMRFHFDLHKDTQTWRGIYEQSLQAWLTRYVQPGATCLDIGSADGYFALLMAKLSGPSGEVHAFEPCDSAEDRIGGIACIRSNFAANSNFPLASVVLYDSFAGTEYDPAANVTSIDHLVDEGKLAKVDVVKIDVDGGEMDVLRGMRNTLQRFHPHLFVEVHSHELREQVEEFTTQLGYTLRLEMPASFEERPLDFNAFCLSEQN